MYNVKTLYAKKAEDKNGRSQKNIEKHRKMFDLPSKKFE
jgi:hypothetical protein